MPAISNSHLFHAATRTSDKLALFALLAFALASLFKIGAANSMFVLLSVLFLFNGRNAWETLRSSPLVWCGVLYLLYIVIYALVLGITGLMPVDTLSDATKDYVKLGFLPGLVVGYWLYRFPAALPVIVGLIPIGFIARFVIGWEEYNGAAVIRGDDRAAFDESAIHLGTWAIVGVFCGIHMLLSSIGKKVPQWRWALSVIIILVMGGAIVCSQTRTAWALAIVMIPLYAAFVAKLLFSGRTQRRVMAGAVGIFGAALVAVAVLFDEMINERFQESRDTLWLAVTGAWSEAGPSSLGLRLHMFQEGWLSWLERPVFGHGPGSMASILAESAYSPVVEKGFHHFHNSALGMLVEYGLPGLLFFVMMFLVPLVLVLGSLRGNEDRGYALWCAFGLLAILGMSILNDVFNAKRAPFVLALLTGVAVSLHLRHRKTSDRGEQRSSPATR